jgi:ComF family protein
VIRSLVTGTFGALFDLVFPPRCALCDSLLDPAAPPVCPVCQEGFEPLQEPLCERCGQPAPGADRCDDCAASPPPLARIRSALTFGGPAGEAILALKAGGRLELAAHLADLMLSSDRTGPLARGCDRLVPVPLHRSRLARRGFNQSALLARRLARMAARPVDTDSLLRIRDTASQSSMHDRKERAANVEDAFRASRRHPFSGKRVCLVDDVVTTGATLASCARALQAAGAREVTAVTVARTVHW